MELSIVYVKTDDQGRIVAIDGGYTAPADLSGWTKIDEGSGDKYNLCQTNYLPKALYTVEGIPRYKLADNRAVERSEAEIHADRSALPPMPPSESERIAALEAAMLTLLMGGAVNV